MPSLGSALRQIAFVLGVLLLVLLAQGLWILLLSANIATGLKVPWSAVIALALLSFGWRAARGDLPALRSARLQGLCRANPVPVAVTAWALIANGFAILMLAFLWTLFQRIGGTTRSLPRLTDYPVASVTAVFVTAALVGAVSEEVGLRGFIQGRLEALLPWPAAIAVTALMAAPAHALSQGWAFTTLVFYLIADTSYGLTARLTDSIFPGTVAHAAGLLFFFLAIWSGGSTSWFASLYRSSAGMDVALVLLLATLAALSFLRLSLVAAREFTAEFQGQHP